MLDSRLVGDVFVLILDKTDHGGWEEPSGGARDDTHLFLFSGAHAAVVSCRNQKLASPTDSRLEEGQGIGWIIQVSALNSALLAGPLLLVLP